MFMETYFVDVKTNMGKINQVFKNFSQKRFNTLSGHYRLRTKKQRLNYSKPEQ